MLKEEARVIRELPCVALGSLAPKIYPVIHQDIPGASCPPPHTSMNILQEQVSSFLV
jgi:hypothetical protein